MKRQVPLSKPDIKDKEIKYVNEVLRSGVLSIGPKIKEFENAIANYIGVKHAIAVNSGTSALHLIIRSLGIKEGDEVITTPFSFIASANCILFERAIPVFVDIDSETLNLDISQIEEKITNKTKAILCVDVFGQPINMVEIKKIAKKYNLYVIEDSCEALGSIYGEYKAGSLGDAAAFAFYPNKQITTAEGGVIVTNNDKVAELCRSMRSQGRAITGLWLYHERLGYNYRLSEIHAALGLAQMERIDTIIEKRDKVARYYNEKLEQFSWIKRPVIDPNVTKMSWFVYVIRVNKNIRNKLIDFLRRNGIECKPYFTPIHLQPFYKEQFGYKEGDFPNTEKAGDECIAIPFYTNLGKKDIDYVVDVIKKFEQTF
ncbi:DegT/DnrJ/EryC1/StrS family aminotransferase [Defluviitalea phaphyphila]|uniref:DegT/DnrJ/EryC1/StrS family aminotransferase n=1 Tax=Defluviitalea phaphyphila TaxID=1473580 RepID=UPI0007315852|nr:DegT/DnrJ/EryC1/StrS family aminotransferase [Defluviitalea phaphyphila]